MILKIGHLDYTVRWTGPQEDGDAFGRCHTDEQVITLRRDVSPGRQLDTLIHEVIHACYDAHTREGNLGEEAVASFLGSALAGVVKANPEFLAALKRGAQGRAVLS